MEHPGKAHLSEETFDEFLASIGLLAVCEEDAIKAILADRKAATAAGTDLGRRSCAAD